VGLENKNRAGLFFERPALFLCGGNECQHLNVDKHLWAKI
jgi:hypothetical protein